MIFTDIRMAITHLEDINFPDGFSFGLIGMEVFRLFSADVDDFDSIFLPCIFTNTSSNNTTDTSVK